VLPARAYHSHPHSQRMGSQSPIFLAYILLLSFIEDGEYYLCASAWRNDGKELYLFSIDQQLMAVDIQQDGSSLRLGTPYALFKASAVSGPTGVYKASPDGKKFVMNTVLPQIVSEPLTLITNWLADLKQ